MQASDSTLWDTFRAGDEEAFKAIYNRYIGELLTYGDRVCDNRQLVKDCIQSLFLYMWERRSRLSPTDSIKFYLFRSLRNAIIQARRREFQPLPSEEEGGGYPHEELEVSIEQIFIHNEIHEAQQDVIARGIKSLTPRQQEIIQLRYYHNLHTDEIANLLNINNQSVRNLLHRSLVELRSYFSAFPRTWATSLLAVFFC
jgi:RNA polymerase sigma factor (sigma-70 family)